MKCNFRNDISHPVCKLGLYGGMPSVKICEQCIERGQNNESYAKELFAKVEHTHPSTTKRISGCCDNALNYR